MKPTNKLMKRLSLYLFLILFTFPTPSQADDIRDFQIEGMSIGGSLLDYYSKKEINAELKKHTSNYKSKKFIRNGFRIKGNSVYKKIGVHYKNDGSYEIVALSGLILYRNNIDECYTKQNEISKDLATLFPSAEKKHSKWKYSQDNESTFDQIKYKLNFGQINILCRDWSKKIEKNKNWVDNLAVEIWSPEFIYWIRNEAYK